MFAFFDIISLLLCAIHGQYELPQGPNPDATTLDDFIRYAVIDGSPFYFILFLRFIWIILELLFGIKCLKTAKNPTRRETWILVKLGIMLIVAFCVITSVIYIVLLKSGFHEISESESYQKYSKYSKSEADVAYVVLADYLILWLCYVF